MNDLLAASRFVEQSGDVRRKIVTLPELRGFLNDVRSATPRLTVVHCHGCFDLVHPGHIRHLQFARSQGDLLIVSITADAVINKGDSRPYIPQELRAENLAALHCVDYVVIDPHPTAMEILTALCPDVYVKGQEYATNQDPRFLAERAQVESAGGRVVYSSGEVVFSSTRLVDALSPSPSLDAQRLSTVCRRHNVSPDSLTELLSSLDGRRVLVLGDSTVERYVLCDPDSLANESPMMTLRELDSEDYLGAAANIALQTAAFGARVVLVTGLGRDALSEWVVDTLESFGIEVVPIHDRNEIPLQTRFLVDDRKMFKLCRGHVRPLDAHRIGQAADLVLEHAGRCDAAIVFDAGLELLSPGLVQSIGKELRRRVPFLAANLASARGSARGLTGHDLLCGSERRLRHGEDDTSSGISELAFRLLDRTQAGRLLVTLGKRGVVTFDRRTQDRASPSWRERLSSEYLPSLSDRVIDRLGITEAFLTTAALALSTGGNPMQSAYLASVVAAMRIASIGPVPVTAREVEKELTRRVPPDDVTKDETRRPKRQAPHVMQAV